MGSCINMWYFRVMNCNICFYFKEVQSLKLRYGSSTGLYAGIIWRTRLHPITDWWLCIWGFRSGSTHSLISVSVSKLRYRKKAGAKLAYKSMNWLILYCHKTVSHLVFKFKMHSSKKPGLVFGINLSLILTWWIYIMLQTVKCLHL